jgi:dihydrofolate reductase
MSMLPAAGLPFRRRVCFVLTHRAHEDVVMAGGAFRFVTDGLTAALDLASAAAGDKNVLVHSPDVAQQIMRAGLLDELRPHLVPVLLGEGTRLFDHVSGELSLSEVIQAPDVTHLRYRLPR